MFTYEELMDFLCAPLAVLNIHTSTTELVEDENRSPTPPHPVEDDDTDVEMEDCKTPKKPFQLCRIPRMEKQNFRKN